MRWRPLDSQATRWAVFSRIRLLTRSVLLADVLGQGVMLAGWSICTACPVCSATRAKRRNMTGIWAGINSGTRCAFKGLLVAVLTRPRAGPVLFERGARGRQGGRQGGREDGRGRTQAVGAQGPRGRLRQLGYLARLSAARSAHGSLSLRRFERKYVRRRVHGHPEHRLLRGESRLFALCLLAPCLCVGASPSLPRCPPCSLVAQRAACSVSCARLIMPRCCVRRSSLRRWFRSTRRRNPS